MNSKAWILAAIALPVAALALHGCQNSGEGASAPDEATAEQEMAPTPLLHRIVLTAEVADVAAWEEKFRTHGGMFRDQGTVSPILIGVNGNTVAVAESVEDLDSFMATLESEETIAAMQEDGVNRDSVKVFVLDREFTF